MSTADPVTAFRKERTELLGFCRELDAAEWQADSRAPGWRIQDVVAHLGSSCRVIFTPAALKLMRSNDVERTNDFFVDQRRGWPPARALAEYERWSKLVAGVAGVMSRPPLASARMRLANLGRFPLGQLIGAMVFDHHTHLRHDIAPALDRPAPGTDANRMTVVMQWMMAVLGNQLRASSPAWLDRPLSISLTGPGGGHWLVRPDGTVGVEDPDGAETRIAGITTEFPEWGTRRIGWRDRDVTISGDAEYGARFLDDLNIV